MQTVKVLSHSKFSTVTFWDNSLLSQDELSAEDSSQQSATAPVAIDFSLFLKSQQEEVLASARYFRMLRVRRFECPVALGTDATPERGGTILLGRVQPVQFFVDQANIEYLRTNEKNPSSVGQPLGRVANRCNVAGHEVFGKAALVNPSLHNALKSGARQPCVLREHPDIARIEEVVTRL